MGAACYLCALNCGTIPDQVAGDAVGACKSCGVLACLAHGVRDHTRPAYRCGCCIVGLLTVAAARQADDHPPSAPREPRPDGDAPDDTPSGFALWARGIDDVEDVIADLAGERWEWLRQEMAYPQRFLASADAPSHLRGYARARSARLMAAALVLADRLRLPERELLPALQRVAAELHRV